MEDARNEALWMSPRALAFQKWCLEDAWRMCAKCGRMVPQKFQAKHARGKAKAPPQLPACGYCKSAGASGYWAPSPGDVPRSLRKLSPEVIEALRPFDIHVGGVLRAPNGYLRHNDMMRFSFKKTSTLDNLAKLPRKQRERGEKALEYLLGPGSTSSYARFWRLHERFLRQRARAIDREEIWAGAPVKRMPANFIETLGLKCALWPHLYWSVVMTDTYVRSQNARRLQRCRQSTGEDHSEDEDGQELHATETAGTRQSAKASYLAKAHASLLGYNSDAQLLHFVYDFWLFTTIGGAKNSARIGIRQAFASKPYSPELWRTYHMALVDLQ